MAASQAPAEITIELPDGLPRGRSRFRTRVSGSSLDRSGSGYDTRSDSGAARPSRGSRLRRSADRAADRAAQTAREAQRSSRTSSSDARTTVEQAAGRFLTRAAQTARQAQAAAQHALEEAQSSAGSTGRDLSRSASKVTDDAATSARSATRTARRATEQASRTATRTASDTASSASRTADRATRKAAAKAAKAAAKGKKISKAARTLPTSNRSLSVSDDSHVLAQSIHDLGAALWFGGAVMGVAGVNKSGNDLRDGLDKIRVASSAWTRFAPAEWTGIAAVLLAGTQLTRASKGRLAYQHGWARAGGTKAAIAVAGAGATAYAAYSGSQIGKLAEQAQARGQQVDVQDASQPNSQTPPEIAAWQKKQRAVQYLVPVLAGGNIVLNSYLVQTYRPGATAKGFVRRLLHV